MRAIDADSLPVITDWSKQYVLYTAIEAAPTLEVKPVVYAKWLEKKRWNFGRWHKWLECSNCEYQDNNLEMYEDMPFIRPFNFCPNCGADMRGG